MTPVDRPLSGDVMIFDLDAEREHSIDAGILGRSGRSARTLIKDGPLRVTLVLLGPAGELAEHEAEGAITLQVLEGRILFKALGQNHDLGPGQLLTAARGIRHSVESPGGGAFLLTLAMDPAGSNQ